MTQILALTVSEQEELETCEVIIENGLQTYVEVGTALQQIRDNRLYRAQYGTFEDYCQQRWRMARNYANKQIAAAEVMRNLGTNVPIPPANEAQARPLTVLSPAEQRDVYQHAVDTAPDGKVTAAHIQRVVNTHRARVGSFDPDESLEDQLPPEERARHIDLETGEIVTQNEPELDASPPVIVTNGRQKPKTNRASDEDSPPFDRCQTPAYALDPLLPFLSIEWLIWEPAAGEGLLAGAMMNHGLSVITSDILDGRDCLADVSGLDFLTDDALDDCDVQVTNPPYSKKYEWLARSYAIGKPFALLLPVETLGAKTAQALFRLHGIEVILMDSRVNFKMPAIGWDGSAAQFPVAWFCWGLNIGQQLTFAHVEVRPDDR